MKRFFILQSLLLSAFLLSTHPLLAQERRPIDSQHPMWMIHVDVWNKADPQKIIDLIPEDIRPYVCMNLSLSCQYDKTKNVYKMPQQAIRTYKSWGTVCQHNGLWFTCQPASGGHSHLQDNDLETFEYMFKRFPNFLGWNFAEQFWGFDEQGDKSSAKQADRIALFAKLVPMHHQYGGVLTISFCGNIWSHGLNPVGMMKRDKNLLAACRKYPDAILWLFKYTTSSCWYNNESVTFSPFISGLANNYGVRYDNCGWNGAMDALFGENHGKKYPIAAGIGTVMEQTAVNGGAVWDGPELIWTEDFRNLNNSTVDGYTRRNWGTFDGFQGAWIDMFRKIIDGTIYIPTRQEVVEKTKIAVINNNTSGNEENMYAAWGTLYDGLYKQDDPTNRNNGQWMDNLCYFKKSGRYGAIPVCVEAYDKLAKAIPLKLNKSAAQTRWNTVTKKLADFDKYYPEVSTGDLYVNRYLNQLVTYTPYTYLNKRRTATGLMPLQYNSCDSLQLTLGKLGTCLVREYADHIDFYLNNYRTDTTSVVTETIVVKGAAAEPSYTMKKGLLATGSATAKWDAETGSYTLTVKHIGSITLTVNCAGNNDSEDLLPIIYSPSLATPQQPAPYHGEIIIEAEDMDYRNIKSCVTDPYGWYPSVIGHAGNGFADMGTNTAGALRHQLTVAEAGQYNIAIRYTCATKAGRIRAQVNSKNNTLTTEQTAVNEWRKVSFPATLKKGTNNLVITNIGALPMYIDQVIYTPADVEPERFAITIRKGSYGSITPSVTEALEGDTVTLSITATKGYGLKELRVINSVYYTLEKTISLETLDNGNTMLTFVMPDDNVTLQPVFAKGTNVADGIMLLPAEHQSSILNPKSSIIYDLSGRRLPASRRGINIVTTSDGRVRKVVKR